MKEQEYHVQWEISLPATDPQAAAEKALVWLRDDSSICHVFTTRDESGIRHSVDLDEVLDIQVSPIPPDTSSAQARKEEALHNIDTLLLSCEEGREGTWDCSTTEGREAFDDMTTLLERVKSYIQ